MPTPIQLPDTVYDTTHPWQSSSETIAGARAFRMDPVERGKIVVALDTANPDMPESVIRERLATPYVPPRFGFVNEALTVNDMFSRNLGHVNDFGPANFSGQQGSFSGTSTPSVPPW